LTNTQPGLLAGNYRQLDAKNILFLKEISNQYSAYIFPCSCLGKKLFARRVAGREAGKKEKTNNTYL